MLELESGEGVTDEKCVDLQLLEKHNVAFQIRGSSILEDVVDTVGNWVLIPRLVHDSANKIL